MAEGNGIAARIEGLAGSQRSAWEEIREQRERVGQLREGQAVLERRADETESDIKDLGKRIDRMATAFWAAAAALGGFSLTAIGIIATLLARGG